MKVLITLLIITSLLQGCKPFQALPNSIKESSEIISVYSNDCDSTDSKITLKKKLWQHIDEKNPLIAEGLVVKFQLTKDNKLKAELILGDSIIAKKIIDGQFKSDQCFYKRRSFKLVPILPILWWFKNKQKRIYCLNNILVLEEKFDTGGTFIIMAGGNNSNSTWFYKKK